MTLETKLLHEVPKWRPAPGERELLSVVSDDGVWCARLTADRCEELGVALFDIRFERLGAPLHLTHEQLAAWAQKIAQTSSVLDPLVVVEIDKIRGRAQIRSANPKEREGRPLYYEILLSRAGQIDVQRFAASGTEREQVVFVLTHENLGRLASQLTDITI